ELGVVGVAGGWVGGVRVGEGGAGGVHQHLPDLLLGNALVAQRRQYVAMDVQVVPVRQRGEYGRIDPVDVARGVLGQDELAGVTAANHFHHDRHPVGERQHEVDAETVHSQQEPRFGQLGQVVGVGGVAAV